MMTETLVGVSPLEKASKKAVTSAEAEQAAVRELVKAARAKTTSSDNRQRKDQQQ
jgi:hypothetical protein